MARSTVGEPNGAKAKAAGAEGAKHKPSWRVREYGDSTFRIDGGNLESLQVRSNASLELGVSETSYFPSKSGFIVSPDNIQWLSDVLLGLHQPEMKIVAKDLCIEGGFWGSTYYRKAMIIVAGWRDATDEQRQVFTTARKTSK